MAYMNEHPIMINAEKSSAAKFAETILALNYLRSVRSLYLDTAKIQSVV